MRRATSDRGPAWSSPSGPPPASPGRTTSRTSSDRRSRTACAVAVADARPAARVSASLVVPHRRGRRARRPWRARPSWPPARSPRAPSRYDAIELDRGRRAPRRVAPRRSRLGRDARSASTSRPRGSTPRSSCSPRSPAGRRSRRSRSSASATSASTTSSRRRPTRAGAPRRRSSGRSTRPRRRITGPPAARTETVERPRPPTTSGDRTRAALDPARMALIVGGDLDGARVVRPSPSGCSATGRRHGAAPTRTLDDARRRDERFVRVVHRPGAVQTEIRVGHPGVPRRHPGLPRRLGDERDPGRPVQLPAEHEAARGEGLHLRRERGLRHAARRAARSRRERRSTPMSRSRRSSTARRARPDPRGAGRPTPS